MQMNRMERHLKECAELCATIKKMVAGLGKIGDIEAPTVLLGLAERDPQVAADVQGRVKTTVEKEGFIRSVLPDATDLAVLLHTMRFAQRQDAELIATANRFEKRREYDTILLLLFFSLGWVGCVRAC